MSITDRITTWLSTFEEIGQAERITPDLLGGDDLSLGMLPDDSVSYYLNGERDITKYLLFRIRLQTLSHGDRKEANKLCESIANTVWQKNLHGDLPTLDANCHAQSIGISQPPYLLTTSGKDGVYQMGLVLNYIETRG